MRAVNLYRLRQAITAAFTQNSLQMALDEELGKDLGDLVQPGSFDEVVYRLLKLADREDWMAGLLKALAQRSNNRQLRQEIDEAIAAIEAPGPTAKVSQLAGAVEGWQLLAPGEKNQDNTILERAARRMRFTLVAALVVLLAAATLGLLLLRTGGPPAATDHSPAANGHEQTVIQSSGTVAELLQQLRDANVLISVEPAAMQSWLENPDEKYHRIADAILAVLKGRRLKHRANLDVVVYKYALVLGLQSDDDLPPQPTIDSAALQKALVWAYNEQNGMDAKSLNEILQ